MSNPPGLRHNKYSDLKIFGFPAKIESFRENIITAPIYVRIKPINRCMHACHWCVYSDGHTRPKDRPAEHLIAGMHETMKEADVMPLGKALELLDDLQKMGTKAVTFSGGGEPLAHPDICLMFERTIENGLDLSIITNGQALLGERAELLEGAKWVRISIDYTNAEQMAKSRNVPLRSFEQVMRNIEDFAAARSEDCDLGINFIVTRENHADLADFAIALRSLGVDNIRFSPVYCQGFQEYHAPIAARVEEQLRQLQAHCSERFTVNSFYDLASPSKVPSRPFTRCLYAQTVPVVGADLGVYACHNTAYSEHGLLGSIKDQSFERMWNSSETHAKLRALNPSKVCNHECANHSKVELFDRLAQASSDNFV